MLSFLLVVIGLLTVGYFYVKKKFSYWARFGVPFDEPKFPFGNLKLRGKRDNFSLRLAEFYKKGRKTGFPFFGLYFFLRPVILAVDLEFVRTVLIKDFNVFADRGTYYNEKDDPLSAHLFNLKADKWRVLRSKLTPTFTSGKMKFMFPTIVSVAEEFVDCLKQMTKDDNEIEIRDVLGRFTTDVIGSCAFGIHCNSLKDPNATFRMMGKKVFDVPKLSGPMRSFIVSFPRLALWLGVRSEHKDVSDFFMKIVSETIEYREKNNVRRNDFMDLLIQLKNEGVLKGESSNVGKLTLNEIAAQAYVFFLAGFETSSTTLTYVFYELAQEKNKHMQDKARNEIQTVLDRHNGQLTYESLSEMHYLEQIINESLRKYPPAGVHIRVVGEDYQYEDLKFKLAKNARIIIPAYGIHHDPEYYENPEEFIPERFEPEEVKKRPTCSFIPFGDGPRNCIGLRFGILQAKIGLMMLLKHFKFTTCDRTDPMPLEFSVQKFVLSPKDGIWLGIEAI